MNPETENNNPILEDQITQNPETENKNPETEKIEIKKTEDKIRKIIDNENSSDLIPNKIRCYMNLANNEAISETLKDTNSQLENFKKELKIVCGSVEDGTGIV